MEHELGQEDRAQGDEEREEMRQGEESVQGGGSRRREGRGKRER